MALAIALIVNPFWRRGKRDLKHLFYCFHLLKSLCYNRKYRLSWHGMHSVLCLVVYPLLIWRKRDLKHLFYCLHHLKSLCYNWKYRFSWHDIYAALCLVVAKKFPSLDWETLFLVELFILTKVFYEFSVLCDLLRMWGLGNLSFSAWGNLSFLYSACTVQWYITYR